MRVIRKVPEAEAIGEFLRNEFYEPEYNRDRDRFEELVMHPNFADANENALRRALLYRRRGHMWRELPRDTQWMQVEIDTSDLERIRVFPRAHWRKISNGDYKLSEIVERIRSQRHQGAGEHVIKKIQQFRYRLLHEPSCTTTVLLIGTREDSPLTILEGNHRLAAAALVSPQAATTHFKYFCGLSPRMNESCWYETNVSNLWRYLKNRISHIYDEEADIRSLLPHVQMPSGSVPLVKSVRVEKLSETNS